MSVGIDAIVASNALSATQFGIPEEEELLLLPHCSKLYQFSSNLMALSANDLHLLCKRVFFDHSVF